MSYSLNISRREDKRVLHYARVYLDFEEQVARERAQHIINALAKFDPTTDWKFSFTRFQTVGSTEPMEAD